MELADAWEEFRNAKFCPSWTDSNTDVLFFKPKKTLLILQNDVVIMLD